jgi:hypothetical protein
MSYPRVGPAGRAVPTVSGDLGQIAGLADLVTKLAADGWFVNGTTNVVPQAPNIPASQAATSIGSASFVANWAASAVDSTHDAATSYRLDVSTNSGFTALVSGYNDLNVGNVTSYTVSGLAATTAYWFRLRAVNAGGTSGNSSSQTLTTTAAGSTQTFSPTIIPKTDPEIANPLRGPHIWHGGTQLPTGWPPMTDSYFRIHWSGFSAGSQLEGSTAGSYDFSALDSECSAAIARGGRFGFGAMSADAGYTQKITPGYVTGQWQASGFWGSNWVPDWNSNSYLTAWENLMSAIANHVGPGGLAYKDEPHLGWLDIGGFGDWDEWHTYPWDSGGPSGQAQYPTNASVLRMIRACVDNFPLAQVCANSDHNSIGGLTTTAITLGDRPRCGITCKCFGSSSWGGDGLSMNNPPGNAAWQVGLFFGEWCNDVGSGGAATFASQVTSAHISMIGNGNQPSPDPRDTITYKDALKNTGYRIQLDSLTLPTTIVRGTGFSLVTTWENVNVAPTYLGWTIRVELRASALSAAVWTGTSTYDLKTLLPTSGTPASHTDTFTVPGGVSASTYHVVVRITDNQGVSVPLSLAIAGRQSDGSYDLGTVAVS